MSEEMTIPARRRVLSGMRPTGRLHLGNYVGALKNWVALQGEVLADGSPKYECYFFIADYHALTTDYADTSKVRENVFEVALDFLSAGLNEKLCTVFVQSHVPQHAELNLLLGMITSVGWLERIPSYKDQQEQMKEKDLSTYGFLGYPLLMSADILVYQPDFVPVGQDQAAHVELTREVARRFNHFYSPRRLVGKDPSSLAEEPDPSRSILPEPEVLLTPSPKLAGIDGRKMSKSYGNSILLSDPPGNILEKMLRMTNRGQREPQSEPGNPDICPVGDMHALFSESIIDNHIRLGCRTAQIACIQCKSMASNGINAYLAPIRQRRRELEANPDRVWSILQEGGQRAAKRAEVTMEQVRAVMGLARTPPVSGVGDKRAYTVYEAGRAGHDLSPYGSWWDLEKSLRARNVRDHWRYHIIPREITLTQDSDRVFITRKKKRVYVTTSREDVPDTWGFEAKPKSYEVLALLCWDKELRLRDFIVPQLVYGAPWTAYKKSHKNENLIFSVRRSGDTYHLDLPGASIEITQYLGQYAPMA